MKKYVIILIFCLIYTRINAQSGTHFTLGAGHWHSTIATEGIKTASAFSFGIEFKPSQKIYGANIEILSPYQLSKPHRREWADGSVYLFNKIRGGALTGVFGQNVLSTNKWGVDILGVGGLAFYSFFNEGEEKQPNSGRNDFLLGVRARGQYKLGRYAFIGAEVGCNLSPNIEVLNGKLEPLNEISFFTTKIILGIRLW